MKTIIIQHNIINSAIKAMNYYYMLQCGKILKTLWQLKEVRHKNWPWWCIPVIPAFRRLKQEDHEFETSVGYIVSFRLAWAT
jgi:hypothetical protein